MSEIIEQIGDIGYPVGLTIRFGILGVTSVPLGSNVAAFIGEASHGPGMTVMPLTSAYEVNQYFKSGPLSRAGNVAFANSLPAGYLIRVMGDGHAPAKKYLHDGQVETEVGSFFGDGSVGPYSLPSKCYTQNVANSVAIGVDTKTIVYSEDELATGKVYLDQENGTLTFYTGEGPDADEEVEYSLEHYGNLGVAVCPSDGITGNSGRLVVADGTFPGHDVEEFPGDGTEGPYSLQFNDLIEDDSNQVIVAGTERTIVYNSGDLGSGKVYVNKTKGQITFFASQEPTEAQAISVNLQYKTKKVTIYDGSTYYPAIDNLVDLVAIQAALMYNAIVTFTPDAYATHLPANGSYQLAGGDDGGSITTQSYADAMDVLFTYIETTMVNVSSVMFCRNTIDDGEYDLIPVMAGKLNEAKKNFYPMQGMIGLDPNEDPTVAMNLVSNFANYELSIIMNPWDKTTPHRFDATAAVCAAEATAPLGTSCARRATAQSLQGLSEYGLLNLYRRETVKALHNARLDVLIKFGSGPISGAGGKGIFTFYGRNTALEEQYRERVDVRTINYMTWVIKYITDMFYFAKNTPSVRATLREDMANVLDRLIADEVMDAYTLDVASGRSEGNKGLVRVRLNAENVGHIKQFVVDYYNGIIDTAQVA
jgi:hypothetical protein